MPWCSRLPRGGVRAVVICPTLIYGVGKGLNPHSIQIPFLVEQARAHGAVRVVGRGLNRWSTVHIDDLTELYRLALEKAPAGSFYFAENGEVSFAEIGEAIATRLGMGPVESVAAEEAALSWGPGRRTTRSEATAASAPGKHAGSCPGAPRHDSALDWIRDEMPL